LLLMAGVSYAGQVQSPVTGPILGYMWDRGAGGLRPILGIPGSSTLGPIADAGAALAAAEIAPGQDYALAVAAGSGSVLLIRLNGPLSATAIDGIPAGPERIILSPSGASAAIYYADRHRIQLLSGLPDAPSLGNAIDIAALPALITAVAVNDGDGLVLVAAPGALYAAGAGLAAPVLVAPIGRASNIAFLQNSRDAVAADYDRNEIILIRDVTGAAQRVVLAGEREGIAKPIAVAVSNQNQQVLAASAGAVAMLGLDGGPPTLVACPCSLSGLHRLKGEAVFRLNDPSSDPMYLLDAGAAQPRVLFVPPGASDAPGPQKPAAAEIPVSRGRIR
jgi:hypothetical protein